MAKIVELREKSNAELEELIENGQDEMFNLRFQHAAMRVADPLRIRTVRREIAQVKSVLHKRQLAVDTAATNADVASAIEGREVEATARYVYEDAAFQVEFSAEGGTVATAKVDLNQKKPRGRRARAAGMPNMVTSVDVK